MFTDSTPLRHYVALFAPLGNMSLDSQVATLPYESSSFATSRGRKGLGQGGSCGKRPADSGKRIVGSGQPPFPRYPASHPAAAAISRRPMRGTP